MAKRIFVLVVLLFVIPLFTTFAQEATSIEYGQVITDELTNSRYEINYSFQGNEGSVIIIEMKSTERLSDLRSPGLILVDAENNIVADTTRSFAYQATVLAAQLPSDGEYTIIATRRDGRTGDSVGEFTLELILPEVLTEEMIINGSASSEDRAQYYTIQAEKDFSLHFQKTGGQLSPEVAVATLGGRESGLETQGTISGKLVTLGLLGVFEGGVPYVVRVGEAPFDFNMNEVTVEFTLGLLVEK